MKKILSVLVVLLFGFTLVACGKDTPEIASAKEALDSILTDPDNINKGFQMPTEFQYGVTGVWSSSDESLVKFGESVDGISTARVSRPTNEKGNGKVTITAELRHDKKKSKWKKDLTIIALPKGTGVSNSFGEMFTLDNIGKTFVVDNVQLYGEHGGGYYLSTADGVIAYVNGKSGMPDAGKTFEAVATVDNYFGSYQLKDLNFAEIDNTAKHDVKYADYTISEFVKQTLPNTDEGVVYGHPTYKFKDVKFIIDTKADSDARYQLFMVDNSFKTGTDVRTKDNSILVYYHTAILNDLKALHDIHIEEINLVLEGYRTDKNVWYVSGLQSMDDVVVGELTDEQKAGADSAKLKQPVEVIETKDGALKFDAKGEYSTIEWSLKDASHSNFVNLTTGKVTIPTDGTEVTVTLVAKVKVNEVVVTREFKVVVGEPQRLSIADVKATGKNEKAVIGRTVIIEGVVTGQSGNNQITVQSGKDAIVLYGENLGKAVADKGFNFALGEKVVVQGTKDLYNGLYQVRTTKVLERTTEGVTIPDFTNLTGKVGNINASDQSKQVIINDLLIIAHAVDAKNGNVTMTLEASNGKTISFRWDARVEFEGSDKLAGFKKGDYVKVNGATLAWFNGAQLTVFADNQIVKAPSDDLDAYLATKALKLTKTAYEAKADLDIPTTVTGYPNVTVEWALADAANIDLINIGTKKVTPKDGEFHRVVLIATVKQGTAKFEKEFIVSVGVSNLEAFHTFSFGDVAKTGYNLGDLVWSEGDVEFTAPKDRLQINASTVDYQAEKGQQLVFAPIDTALVAHIEFDFTDAKYEGLAEFSFELAAWSDAAFTGLSKLTDPKFVIEFKNAEGVWVTVSEIDLKVAIGKGTHRPVSVPTTHGKGVYKFSFVTTDAKAKNTTQAITLDNLALLKVKAA